MLTNSCDRQSYTPPNLSAPMSELQINQAAEIYLQLLSESMIKNKTYDVSLKSLMGIAGFYGEINPHQTSPFLTLRWKLKNITDID